MKKKWLLFVVVLTQYIVHSQYHEIGIFIGGANYVGDVGSSNYIFPRSSMRFLIKAAIIQDAKTQKVLMLGYMNA